MSAPIALVFLLFACTAALAQQPPPAAPPASVALNVHDFGAVGDAKADDTVAIQKALDQAAAAGGGIVWAPRGNYRIATHITIPASVTLQGVWTIPTAWTQMQGTTLLAEEGRGTETGPAFITLGPNATVKGLTIFYPGQDQQSIQPYPWCVACAGGDNASIVDVLMVNPFKAVDFASHPSGRHYIRNLYGQPLRIGISVDKCYDVGRIENVHFWPFWGWDGKPAIQEYMRKNAVSFIFGRTDWEYVLNTFSLGYKIGYQFIQTRDGGCNGNFLGIGADATNTAVQVDECQGIGLLITNGEFVSLLDPEPTEVVVSPTNTGLVQFNNCAFWGPAERIASLKGSGSVSFTQCHFMHWDRANKGTAAIDCEGGSLTVSSSRFSAKSPGIKLGPDVRTAVIFGNTFNTRQQVSNESKGDVQVGLNASLITPIRAEAGETIVDEADGKPAFVTTGAWTAVEDPGYLGGRAIWAVKGTGEATATWKTRVSKAGRYEVSTYIGPDPNHDHAKDAAYTVMTADGPKTVRLDQTTDTGKWRVLGTFSFTPDLDATVTLSNAAGANVIADAVKWRLVR